MAAKSHEGGGEEETFAEQARRVSTIIAKAAGTLDHTRGSYTRVLDHVVQSVEAKLILNFWGVVLAMRPLEQSPLRIQIQGYKVQAPKDRWILLELVIEPSGVRAWAPGEGSLRSVFETKTKEDLAQQVIHQIFTGRNKLWLETTLAMQQVVKMEYRATGKPWPGRPSEDEDAP